MMVSDIINKPKLEERVNKKQREKIEQEIQLHINHQLFIKGYITESMYMRAQNMICKQE